MAFSVWSWAAESKKPGGSYQSFEMDSLEGEKLQNSLNQLAENEPLEVGYYCTRIKDQVNVVLELRPQELPKHNSFGYPIFRGAANDTLCPPTPIRVVVVIDVSHSMNDLCDESASITRLSDIQESIDHGDDYFEHNERAEGSQNGITKLQKVKMFVELMLETLGSEDFLSVVTFGTKSSVIFPLRKMTPENKQDALMAIKDIAAGGVTNMAAGLLAGVEQFSTDFVKRRYYDDNIMLFTDGMANEGLVNPKDVIRELSKKITTMKQECRYEKDYFIKITTLGTSGFLPELVFRVGQQFSSDAYYFLDVNSDLELNLMKPILLRQSSLVTNVKIIVAGQNGVVLSNNDSSSEYEIKSEITGRDGTDLSARRFHIHDIAKDMQKHFVCILKLPSRHKKTLKGKPVLTMTVQYTDMKQEKHTIERVVHYDEIPRRETSNNEHDMVVTTQQHCRLLTHRSLLRAAVCMKKLNRAAAKAQLQETVDEITKYCEYVSNFLTGEEKYQQLMEFIDPLVANLHSCRTAIGKLTFAWDDAWGRIMALASSISREVPSSSNIYANGSELYANPKLQEKLADLCGILRDMYRSQGLDTSQVDNYLRVVKELEDRMTETPGYLEIPIDDKESSYSSGGEHLE